MERATGNVISTSAIAGPPCTPKECVSPIEEALSKVTKNQMILAIWHTHPYNNIFSEADWIVTHDFIANSKTFLGSFMSLGRGNYYFYGGTYELAPGEVFNRGTLFGHQKAFGG